MYLSRSAIIVSAVAVTFLAGVAQAGTGWAVSTDGIARCYQTDDSDNAISNSNAITDDACHMYNVWALAQDGNIYCYPTGSNGKVSPTGTSTDPANCRVHFILKSLPNGSQVCLPGDSFRNTPQGLNPVANSFCGLDSPTSSTDNSSGQSSTTVQSNAPAKSSLKFISTYLQPGTTHPDRNYLPEMMDHFSAVHLGPQNFGSVRQQLKAHQAIVDLPDELFDFDNGTLKRNYQDALDSIGKKYLDGYEQKIMAFYIADEPTGYGITRRSLEAAIAAVKKRFPNIPTYIVWYKNCFDNDPSADYACQLAGQRGIPEGLDWVGFDWYLQGYPSDDKSDFQTQIVATVQRLKAISNLPIILVPDNTDEFVQNLDKNQQDSYLSSRLKMYFDFAQNEPRVMGMDSYAWADHTEGGKYVRGLRGFPTLQALLFQYADGLKEP